MNQRNSRIRTTEIYIVLVADLISIIISYFMAHFIKHGTFYFTYERQSYIAMLIFSLFVSVVYSMMMNPSNGYLSRGYLIEMISVIKYNGSIMLLSGSLLFLLKMAEGYSRLMFLYYILINGLLTFILHILLKKYVQRFYSVEKNQIKMLIITECECANFLLKTIKEKMSIIYHISGIVIWDGENSDNVMDIPIMGDADNYLEKIKLMALDEVYIYLPNQNKKVIKDIIDTMQTMGVVCHYNIDVADLHTRVRTIDEVAGFTVVTYSMNDVDYNKRMIKRAIDIIGGIVGSLFTIILVPFIATAIKIESRGPVFFKQKRVGRNGRVFSIYKFRSMYQDAEERKKELEKKNEVQGLMFKMKNDPRITKVGAFIRKTSMDELPQFFNILKGDMSLVGTRPPTIDEYEKYSFHYKRRLSMTPGLTGMWQVKGRSSITNFDDVVAYDLEYIDNWSLTLDIKILFQTIGVVLFQKGAK